MCRPIVSLMDFSQRVVKVYFPPPLDVTRRTQHPQNSAEQHVISRASSSWWFIGSCNQESTRSTTTTMSTTNTNTVRGNLQESITTLYLLAIYNVYNVILQVHGMYIIYFSFLYLFPLKPAWFTCHKNPPNKCAEITRRNDPRKIRRGNLPDLCATLTRWIYSPEIGANATRGICLPENPPSPLRIPRQDPARHPPPPPATPHNVGGGRGQGAGDWPGSPMHPEQVLLLSFPLHEWLHILIWHNIYAFYTERINKWKYNYIAFRRKNHY